MAAQNTEKRQSMLAETWRRFKNNKMATVALCIMGVMVLIAIFGPMFCKYGMDEQNAYIKLIGPDGDHFFGTDSLGRDLFTRIIYGTRVSLSAGLFATTLSCAGGILIGASAGYFGGKVDMIISRCVDLMMGIPGNLLAIVLCAVLGASLTNCLIACAIAIAPGMSRTIRGAVLAEAGKEYIEAEQIINASNFRIIVSHIIPNVSSVVIVQYTMGIATSILQCAGLSFIGLGAQPPTAEWGAILSEGRSFIRTAPWVCIFPGIAIMITVFSINLIGDGLRDALDPKLKN